MVYAIVSVHMYMHIIFGLVSSFTWVHSVFNFVMCLFKLLSNDRFHYSFQNKFCSTQNTLFLQFLLIIKCSHQSSFVVFDEQFDYL